FVLVTSPAPMSVREVLFFNERLERGGMPRGAIVVNRLHLPPPGPVPTEVDAARALEGHGLHFEHDAPSRLLQARADAVRLAELDGRYVRTLDEAAAGRIPVVRVPELSTDVRDLKSLHGVAQVLVAGGV